MSHFVIEDCKCTLWLTSVDRDCVVAHHLLSLVCNFFCYLKQLSSFTVTSYCYSMVKAYCCSFAIYSALDNCHFGWYSIGCLGISVTTIQLQFHEFLSSKARPKQRSPSWSSSQELDLDQRLEAKLNAAEQKRLSILSKAQMRLVRLDELRQAAKSEVKIRVEKERDELGMKVESRLQQAEANRMLIQKSRRQRRATRKERTAQSLMRRTMQESKYKECVRAAIHHKRAAAERKRLGLLEAERSKAHARLVRVQRAANSVYSEREMERKKKREQLKDRLQRARRQRAELLGQKKSITGSPRVNCNVTDDQALNLARKLSRCWRRFVKLRGTTFSLAKAFEDLNINVKSVKTMPFEQLAVLIEIQITLKSHTIRCT